MQKFAVSAQANRQIRMTFFPYNEITATKSLSFCMKTSSANLTNPTVFLIRSHFFICYINNLPVPVAARSKA